MIKTQVAARLQAQQTTTVFVATIVSLITSAFGFVAALAWNTALQDVIKHLPTDKIKLGPTTKEVIYAIIVTLVAVIAVVIIRGVASRIAGKDLETKAEHFL